MAKGDGRIRLRIRNEKLDRMAKELVENFHLPGTGSAYESLGLMFQREEYRRIAGKGARVKAPPVRLVVNMGREALNLLNKAAKEYGVNAHAVMMVMIPMMARIALEAKKQDQHDRAMLLAEEIKRLAPEFSPQDRRRIRKALSDAEQEDEHPNGDDPHQGSTK